MMHIIDHYLHLTKQGRFYEALPLIEEIIRRVPHLGAGWFNYGLCLAALGRLGEAADAFLKAYELNPEHGEALYQACIALADAGDERRLLWVFRRECHRDPGLIYLFLEESTFAPYFQKAPFKILRHRFTE